MKEVKLIETCEILGPGWQEEMMGWESSTDVMCGVCSAPWGGLAPCGSGALAGLLLPKRSWHTAPWLQPQRTT